MSYNATTHTFTSGPLNISLSHSLPLARALFFIPLLSALQSTAPAINTNTNIAPLLILLLITLTTILQLLLHRLIHSIFFRRAIRRAHVILNNRDAPMPPGPGAKRDPRTRVVSCYSLGVSKRPLWFRALSLLFLLFEIARVLLVSYIMILRPPTRISAPRSATMLYPSLYPLRFRGVLPAMDLGLPGAWVDPFKLVVLLWWAANYVYAWSQKRKIEWTLKRKLWAPVSKFSEDGGMERWTERERRLLANGVEF